LRDGLDVVALGGRYLVLRRTRAWRAFDALVGPRDEPMPMRIVERRFLRRARQLGLACTVTHRTPRRWLRWWQSLRPSARTAPA
jgi:hypothetical protein